MLKRVGIYDKRDTRFDWLSGGMKRRFMLARALITDPDLLILDEPTAGVDVQLRHELWETIVDLNDSGTTILLTTHYIEEAERLCDEVAILDSGSVIEVASPEELMDRGTDDIVVQLRDPPTAVPDFAADDDRVEAVELDGTRLVVTAQQGGLVAPDVVQALDRQGHEIVDLEISRTSLEEVFVEMTRQGRRPRHRGGRTMSLTSLDVTGFYALLRREVLRFVRRPRNTFVPPFITNVLYFSVFGVILGERINEIAGVPYILFILPGLIVLGAVSNAFENASFSIFHGRWNRYIEEALTSPLSYTSMVGAYVLSSATRGVLVGALVALIGMVFTTVGVAQPFYLVAFMLVITLLFAGLGVVGGLWADDFDDLTMMNQFILRPLVFFGGVFYSLNEIPATFQQASLLNPMIYMVNGVRYGFLGVTEVDPNLSLGVLTALTLGVVGLNVVLFRRGYGLTD